MAIAMVLVLVLQIVQLMNRHQRAALDPILSSTHALWIVPAAFLFVMVTAAFTEEVFFRGLIQRSVARKANSDVAGVLVATIAFSLYHVPYAYLNPAWPSAGDMVHAVQLSFVNGVPVGLIIGALYVRSRYNLIAPILVHAAVDWIPAIVALADAYLPGWFPEAP
jgi:membrane protease YdiL (CAAX protease family)